MDIKRYIKEAHGNAVEKGFYDCPKCHGIPKQINEDVYDITCEYCNHTGINPNKNIGELLMLIISELGEALEAHRCGRFANLSDWEKASSVIFSDDYSEDSKNYVVDILYKSCLKDTFEDEISDVFIRMFDLCGYQERTVLINSFSDRNYSGNIGESFLHITQLVCSYQIDHAISALIHFCEYQNIPIEKHIEAKMLFNSTRIYKHGKEY